MKITEYNQLKHGMKVKVTCISGEHGEVPVVGKISISEGGHVFVCHDNVQADGSRAGDKLGYKYSWKLYGHAKSVIYGHKGLETYEKTLDDLEEGDILVDDDGDFTKVLGVCGQMVFITGYESSIEQLNSNAHHSTWTVPQLKEVGFTVYQPEETEDVIVTLDEIAKLKGVDVSKIKIKK